MDIQARLKKLRALMAERNMDMYVVPTADFHQSEYVGEHFKARKFITGFTGSAGTAVITKEEAFLWTDGRYFLQAGMQLEGTTVELMKEGEPGVPTIEEYMAANLPENGVIGFDGRVVAMGEGQGYAAIASAKDGKVLFGEDLIDMIWEDRPVLSEEPVFALGIEYTGESTAEKLARVREEMKVVGANTHVLTTLDDICWILNMRGNDIEFFPLVLSYMVIKMDSAILFINEAKLNDEIKVSFANDGIEIRPYNDVYEYVKTFTADDCIMLDPINVNYALLNNIPAEAKQVEADNPEIMMKAIKNNTEIANIRVAQIKDSVAHVRFMKWLKENFATSVITELVAEKKLDELRAEMGNFIRPSFAPISAYGEHSAIVHYESSPETDVQLNGGTLFMTDTGAGFWEGSTDITRTYALGEVPQIMKDHFTLVAISNLKLTDAKFLFGSTGMTLDYIAREPFWRRNLNFNHGTGHGVGYLLNIHEGNAGFRWTYRKSNSSVLHPGMIITNEPGIYIAGSHGIRLENEVLCCNGEKNEYGQFMYLEPITYVPMDLDAINPDMMNADEKKLLNDYHKLVFEKVSPYLNEEEVEWLKKYTAEI